MNFYGVEKYGKAYSNFSSNWFYDWIKDSVLSYNLQCIYKCKGGILKKNPVFQGTH